jgi:periplasmic protein TonB
VIAAARAPSSNRLVGIALVVLLHVGLVYLLVSGLALRRVEVSQSPIETKIVAPSPEQHVEPPPPPPAFAPPPPPFVPPPEIHIATPPPPPAQSTAITTVTPVRPPESEPTAPPPPHVAVSVPPHIDLAWANSHKPEYPPVSRRLGEEGVVVLQVLVDPSGRASDVKVAQSSGFPRLDQAAVEWTKANYRFSPGTVDGKPQPMWVSFRFNWKLE